ncbi:hypothetical protein F4775DRAFT_532516 [Biscogniauxia sp. FL1348]|nr:hypothetical protein F4775DRAFT_532516 [Biscogniauxia sp. FL1348]
MPQVVIVVIIIRALPFHGDFFCSWLASIGHVGWDPYMRVCVYVCGKIGLHETNWIRGICFRTQCEGGGGIWPFNQRSEKVRREVITHGPMGETSKE